MVTGVLCPATAALAIRLRTSDVSPGTTETAAVQSGITWRWLDTPGTAPPPPRPNITAAHAAAPIALCICIHVSPEASGRDSSIDLSLQSRQKPHQMLPESPSEGSVGVRQDGRDRATPQLVLNEVHRLLQQPVQLVLHRAGAAARHGMYPGRGSLR